MKRGMAKSYTSSGCAPKTIKVRVAGHSISSVLFRFKGKSKVVRGASPDSFYWFKTKTRGLTEGAHKIRIRVSFADGSKTRRLQENVFVCPETAPQFTG